MVLDQTVAARTDLVVQRRVRLREGTSGRRGVVVIDAQKISAVGDVPFGRGSALSFIDRDIGTRMVAYAQAIAAWGTSF